MSAFKWDCRIGTPDEDHEFVYDGGEPDVGLEACWVCKHCGTTRGGEPPSDDYEPGL